MTEIDNLWARIAPVHSGIRRVNKYEGNRPLSTEFQWITGDWVIEIENQHLASTTVMIIACEGY